MNRRPVNRSTRRRTPRNRNKFELLLNLVFHYKEDPIELIFQTMEG